jgi:uncharacterized protein YfaT (DUF1175 family)
MRAIVVLLLVVVAGAWLVPVSDTIEIDRLSMPADGAAVARLRAGRANLAGFAALGRAPSIELSPTDAALLRSHDGDLILRAGHRPGTIAVTAGDARAELVLLPSANDDDEDGLPDAAELLGEEDRAAFTAWFTAIAEAQATAIDDAWPAIHHDCAGLIRFAYREALKPHDASWLGRRKHRISIAHPDVASLAYPELPFMEDLPFRRIAGRFDARLGPEEQFTAAASARTLWQHNTRMLSRRLEDGRAGDLLFFSVPLGSGSRMHSMILLGRHPGATLHEPARRAVYHTGTEVRLVSLDELLAHPDPSWHPLPHNPRFLGVHRLELLVHEPRSPLASSFQEIAP